MIEALICKTSNSHKMYVVLQILLIRPILTLCCAPLCHLFSHINPRLLMIWMYHLCDATTPVQSHWLQITKKRKIIRDLEFEEMVQEKKEGKSNGWIHWDMKIGARFVWTNTTSGLFDDYFGVIIFSYIDLLFWLQVVREKTSIHCLIWFPFTSFQSPTFIEM